MWHKRRKVVVGVYTGVAVRGVPQKGVVRNFGKFTRKRLCWTNEALAQVFSCEFRKICKNTLSAEHHWATASDYSSISSSEGRISKRNSKL